MISDNLFSIKERMEKAAEESGRTIDDIELVAVTKNVGIEECEELIELGENTFGENRVQSFTEKYGILGERAKWHIIGHLQTNKVKYIVGKVSLIHSVDSVHLAQEINRLSEAAGVIQDILLQVNVSGEESKFGMPPEELFPTIEKIAAMQNLKMRGLMTIPPVSVAPGSNRKYFAALYDLFSKINSSCGENISADFLSMGMSDDFEDAIKEGANVIRVGRALYV